MNNDVNEKIDMFCYLCHGDVEYCQYMCSVFPPESCGGSGKCPICTIDVGE